MRHPDNLSPNYQKTTRSLLSLSLSPGPEDADSFQLEMRALLAELGCPHSTLTEGMALLDAFSSRLLLVGESVLPANPAQECQLPTSLPSRLPPVRTPGCPAGEAEEGGRAHRCGTARWTGRGKLCSSNLFS